MRQAKSMKKQPPVFIQKDKFFLMPGKLCNATIMDDNMKILLHLSLQAYRVSEVQRAKNSISYQVWMGTLLIKHS